MKRCLGLVPEEPPLAEAGDTAGDGGGEGVGGGDGGGEGGGDGGGEGGGEAAPEEGSSEPAARPRDPSEDQTEGSSQAEPTQDLTDAEIEELFAAVEVMRKAPSNTDKWVHGWRLIFTLRGRPGSSTRGDMTAIDPRDGQKLYSIVSMRRKLSATEDVFERATATGRAEAEAAGFVVEGKRRRVEWFPPEEIRARGPRSTRNVVNYAEVSSSSATGAPKMSDLVMSSLTDAKESSLTPDHWPGLDYLSIAEAVHARPGSSVTSATKSVPLAAVRTALTSMLRAGRVRRKLANKEQLASDSVASQLLSGSTAYALRMMVLHTLQIAPLDLGAPWTLGLLADTAEADDEAREHVWKGVTPSHLPSIRGADLVGRVVEVWWPGDSTFYAAKVTAFNEKDRQMGYHDGTSGTHVLLYSSGLRVMEHLEGAGEPQQWRLAEEEQDEGLRDALDEAGYSTDEVRRRLPGGFASLRFASLRFPSLRFASLRFPSLPFPSLPFPSLPFPSLGLVWLRFASLGFPSLPFPSLRFASLPFASFGLVWLRFASLRFLSLDFASLRFPSLRFA